MNHSLGRILASGAAVYATWLLLSGHYTGFLLTIGLLCTAGVVYVAIRMDLVDQEGVPALSVTLRVFTYIPWLLLQVVKSNIGTAKVILSPSLPMNPNLFRVRSMPRTDLGRFIFANSITLTPGTITVAVRGDVLWIHALESHLATGMDEGDLNRRVAALEREPS